ncbi:MFS transporter [Salmonella enterica subsp. enterica serovar Typhi]|nr:MFS transporter [Salmonella enterica subsp. enterica serovar Typhi]EDJ9018557.1 MFS transporter [Salmonella enterica subsp. enterica serovar Typhi]EEK5889755.1 MFS transporter [Salmonella enterica subsp. enterica serovar Typhi]EGM4848713.1 MFS transporter [Salmonella enterica subsp. enterica serovar Typhi]EGM6692625.1 MFS transporter [Salmonella enterica subsp. enterica serovar Typhi]
MTSMQKWLRIGATLMFGLFVAYLDRSNLSVTLPTITHDLNIDGATASIVLTIFLIGYAFSNIFGGVFTQRYDPKKIVILMVLIWSIATVFVGFTSSVYVILICRLVLGITEGIYWPQQSRFASDWFSDKERTQANSIIQYYGQFLALGLGFMILSPLDAAFGWRNVFIITGMIGIVVVVPLYITMLKKQEEAPYYRAPAPTEKTKLTLESLGGTPFLLLIFTYITQGMLFWGITLWIPMVVNSLGYTGFSKALVSSLPYLTAVILTIPISWISDKTQKRVLIASLGLLIPGVMLFLLPFVDAPGFKITLITLAMGYYAASFTPNIWSIIQSNVKPHAIGPASGIINGIGAGGGGTLAGLMVGYFYRTTGSYMQGFMVLGCIVILGGASLLIYGRIRAHHARR